MTAYSFGNRWMGIVALKEPPPVVPLHVMANRMRERQRSQRIRIGRETLPLKTVRRLLKSVRYGYVLREQWTLVRASDVIAEGLAAGLAVTIPAWLQRDLLRPRTERTPARVVPREAATPRRSQLVETEWNHALPPAPAFDDRQLTESELRELLGLAGVEFISEIGRDWLNWSVSHATYVHESGKGASFSQLTLKLLAAVGQQWVYVSVVDKARVAIGDYDSAAQVAQNRATYHALVREALGRAVRELGIARLGKGLRAGGAPAGAFEDIGFQVIGTLCLASGSHAPAMAATEALWPEDDADTTDWIVQVQKHLRTDPMYDVEQSGPEHARTFCVTLSSPDGRSASAEASSKKAARMAAARGFAKKYFPTALRDNREPPEARPVRAFDRPSQHVRAVARLRGLFEAPQSSDAQTSQALVHSSWTHENSRLTATYQQNDYRILAAEGAELVRALALHQHALTTFERSTTPTEDQARPPSVDEEALTGLFDELRLADGVLLGKGERLRPSIASDVVQALIAAVWRSSPDRLVARQPEVLRHWLHRFRSTLDSKTIVERHLASAAVPFDIEHDVRGPEHDSEYRAEYRIGLHATPWVGTWESSKTRAGLAAAADLIDLMMAHAEGARTDLDHNEEAVLRAILIGQIQHCASRDRPFERDMASGMLGIDALASGSLQEYNAWAQLNGNLLIDSLDSELQAGLAKYYTEFLRSRRRAAVVTFVREALERAFPDGAVGTDTSGIAGFGTLCEILGESAMELAPLDEAVFTWLKGTSVRYSLDASEAPMSRRVLAPGVSAGLFAVLDLVSQVGTYDAPLELTWSAESERSDGLTIRVRGIDLASSVGAALNAVAVLVPGFMFDSDGDSLRLICPVVPAEPCLLARVGLRALEQTLADPWVASATRWIESATEGAQLLSESTDLTPDDRIELLREIARPPASDETHS
ncbi:putative dsRNA-binding protein [Promicromonospora sp. NPDC023987]|uniref:putative dsRNA-binding protein n=1 Tax=Promicromonospora sp. NPDC023987 TaxID=3155360 RepID=UPI0034088935